jgi:hypothetical protein
MQIQSVHNFLKMMMFDCCRKRNRDGLGIWKMQACVTVIAWLYSIHIFVEIAKGITQS